MKNTHIDNVRIIEIPKIIDEQGRGKLSFIEKDVIPFKIKSDYVSELESHLLLRGRRAKASHQPRASETVQS